MSALRDPLDSIHIRFATFRDLPADRRAALAEELRSPATDERVLIETCHRVELVAVGTSAEAHVSGRDAVRRLFEVVAGFDSAVVAEEQLLGQVRGAYEAALASGTTGPILNELFRRALRFGRRVRSHARPGTDRSLADPGVAWLLDVLPEGPCVAVAGTGEMGYLLATGLAAAGARVTVVSHSAERGGRLLERLEGGGHRLLIGDLTPHLLGEVDGLALAVRTRAYLVTADALGPMPPAILDLSAPPAVAPDVRPLLDDRLLTLDELGARAGGATVLDPGTERRLRRDLETEVDRFVHWLETRRATDAVALLHAEADAVRRRHLARLRSRGGLDEAQLAAVEAASTAMLRELLHGPSVELRHGGVDAAIIRRLFGLRA